MSRLSGDGFFAGNFAVGLTTLLAVAAYMLALDRVASAIRMRGLYA